MHTDTHTHTPTVPVLGLSRKLSSAAPVEACSDRFDTHNALHNRKTQVFSCIQTDGASSKCSKETPLQMVVVEVLAAGQKERRKVASTRRLYSRTTLEWEGALSADCTRLGGCADSSKQHPASATCSYIQLLSCLSENFSPSPSTRKRRSKLTKVTSLSHQDSSERSSGKALGQRPPPWRQ